MSPEFQEQLAQAMAEQQTKTELQEQLRFSDNIGSVIIEGELPADFVYTDAECGVNDVCSMMIYRYQILY